MLYLLHGGGGEYVDWTQETKVEAYTAPLNMIVAMPAAASSGMDGWYTDWQGSGVHGRPLWETFHLTELRQLLERNWQASDQRAVAGLSLGGYGAVLYSERHPGLFKAAASYSGVLDITAYQDHFSDQDATARWGDVAMDPNKLASVNPINLVSALQDMPLYISHGNGEPGPLDPPTKEYDSLEAWVGEGDDHFTAALRLAGIPATVNDYGPGTHSWAYWDRELYNSLPVLAEALGQTDGSP